MQEYSMCSNGPISKVGIVALQQGPIFKGWQVKVRHHILISGEMTGVLAVSSRCLTR